jgi:hypothetical protein
VDAQRLAIELARVPLEVRQRHEREWAERAERVARQPIPFPTRPA